MSDAEEGIDALLMDGRIVHVRPVSQRDTEALSALYTRASPRSRYLRFFSAGVSVDREVQRIVTRSDDHVALVAEHDGLALGVASYEILNGAQAEIAILVDDAWHGDGIGSLLIEHLAAVARRAGIQELVGDVLVSNVTMLRASASLAPGIARQHGEDPSVVSIHIPTRPDERALAAAGARDRTAEHNSLRPLLAPTSLAVIGVSRSQSGVGYEILHGVLAGGFTGRTYPVNPHAKTIDGLECYPSVGAIPERVDLAIVAVPASNVPQIIEECGAAHVGAAVVLSAGFGETGPSGAGAESRLLASARRHDIRVVGPNCIGLISAASPGWHARCQRGNRSWRSRADAQPPAVARAPRIPQQQRLTTWRSTPLFRQAGVMRMDTLGELLDAARLLTEQPLPAGIESPSSAMPEA